MAPARRTTITIPEDLAERLEPWRDKMNISSVCSEAIAMEVALLESRFNEYHLAPKGLSAAIDDLRTMLHGTYDAAETAGYWHGVEYAKTQMTFAELEKIDSSYEPGLHEYYSLIPESAKRDAQETIDMDVGHDEHYWLGWLQGVAQVWYRIKDELED